MPGRACRVTGNRHLVTWQWWQWQVLVLSKVGLWARACTWQDHGQGRPSSKGLVTRTWQWGYAPGSALHGGTVGWMDG